MDVWREKLYQKLTDILDEDGIGEMLEVAKNMLNVNACGDGEFKGKFVGELCECVLCIVTEQYLQRAGKEGRVFHSVVLKNLKKVNSGFRTELDFILATPYFLLTTECKSYSGNVSIHDECTLEHYGRDANVYSQSRLHYGKLYQYATQFLSQKSVGNVTTLPVYANVFLFSNAKVTDNRTKEQRKSIRVDTMSTLFSFYTQLFKRFTKPVFDIDKTYRILDKCASSDKLHQQHKKFVGY